MNTFLAHAVLSVSEVGFTCTESSYHSVETKCNNVFDPDDSVEWITQGEAKGAWIYLEFDAKIMITKVLYRHNLWKAMTNRYFKDVMFEFSDRTKVNVTLHYPNLGTLEYPVLEKEIHLKIDPPVLSSSLKIKMFSGHDLSMSDGKNRPQDWQDRYGISYIQIYGLQKGGR